MAEPISTIQVIAFFWDAVKIIGTVFFGIIAYFLKGWIETQKEHGKKIGQVISDMRSMKEATQATNESIDRLIRHQSDSMDRMEKTNEKTANKMIENFELIVENRILKAQNNSS